MFCGLYTIFLWWCKLEENVSKKIIEDRKIYWRCCPVKIPCISGSSQLKLVVVEDEVYTSLRAELTRNNGLTTSSLPFLEIPLYSNPLKNYVCWCPALNGFVLYFNGQNMHHSLINKVQNFIVKTILVSVGRNKKYWGILNRLSQLIFAIWYM